MKKTITTLLVLMCAIMAQAQVKIATKLEKGMKTVYTCHLITKAAGMEIVVDSKNSYVVTDKLDDGYIVTQTLEEMTSSGGDELTRAAMTVTQKMLLNVPVVLKTDLNGRIVDFVNFEEAKKLMTDGIGKIYDEIVKTNSLFAMQTSKEAFVTMAQSTMTVEQMLKGVRDLPTSPMALNGLTIKNGDKAITTNAQGLKMETTYTVSEDGRTINSDAVLKMTEDDVKAFVIEQVAKTAPQQVEAVKQNFDMLKASGLLKVEANDKIDYKLKANGWMDTIVLKQNMVLMGQNVVTEATIKAE